MTTTTFFFIFIPILSILLLSINLLLAPHNPVVWSGKSKVGDKLSNSGDTLKLLIPSIYWKINCGWTNYSCMVTSQKMYESKIGDRGSKSAIFLALVIWLIFASFIFIFLVGISYALHFYDLPSSSTLTFSVFPVKIYKNADLDKLQIITEAKGKSGVYRWTNLTNGKTYIGSSINLEKRLKGYFSIYYLESVIKKGRSLVNSAILKDGYSKFTLEILEYCEPSETLSREQYYLDLLKPEYNILFTAGSPFGFKHTEETKNRMSVAKIGNKNATGGKGRKRAELAGSPSVSIKVLDQNTGVETIYPSMSAVAKALNVPSGSIRMYFFRNILTSFKKRYIMQKIVKN